MESSYFIHKSRSKKVWTIIGWVILGIIGITAFAFLFGYVVMLLWNWLMPDLFGLKTIVFWQAVGIIILAKLLFGGFSGHGKQSRSGKKPHHRECGPNDIKHGYSKWKHYDKFWKEEGESAYNAYIEKNESVNKAENNLDQKEI
jgi:hypothetical protein